MSALSEVAAPGLLAAGTAGGALFVAFLCGAVLAYGRARDAAEPSTPGRGRRAALELGLWITPTVILVALGWLGLRAHVEAAVAPADATPIALTLDGDQLRIDHGDGLVVTDALRVPAERPVRLTLVSEARPAALVVAEPSLRLEARPGQPADRWLVVPRPGEAIVAGVGATTRLVALAPADYDRWVQDAGGASLPPAEYGRKLYARAQCQTCHSLDGSTITGPSFQGLFGRREPLADGTTVAVDAAYVTESILDPGAKVVRGFQPVMPPFRGQLDDKQVAALVAFIQAQARPAPSAAPDAR